MRLRQTKVILRGRRMSLKRSSVSKISIIAAASSNNIIGVEGRLPWNMVGDLERFKRITMGRPVIMGRKTYASIGHPLEGRTNIVVTRNKGLKIGGCLVVHSLEDAISEAKGEETFIIGGGEIYKEALPRASKIYLTRIPIQITGDTYFPEIRKEEWKLVKEEKLGEARLRKRMDIHSIRITCYKARFEEWVRIC